MTPFACALRKPYSDRPSSFCVVHNGQIDSPEKWRENMEMALEMFKAQKAMMQQQGGAEDDVPVDVDDLDDD